MSSTKTNTPELSPLLESAKVVLDGSQWVVRVTEDFSHFAKITKGVWTPATAAKLAKHYGETISDEEAEKRASVTNEYALEEGQRCIEMAAWIACSNWRTLLWQDKAKPYKMLADETEHLEAKKFLAYKAACCTIVQLQIDDTKFKIEQTELMEVEYFNAYCVTRLTATHERVHRAINIYSREDVGGVFSASKSVEIDDGLTMGIARLMPEEARDKESVMHRLAIGFAPSDEVFELWSRRQIDELREKYKGRVPIEELETLLNDLKQKAFEAKERHDREGGNENRVTTKDVDYFRDLLQEEIRAQRD